MAYTVLARKWRPKTFAEIVGQRHVVQALSNAMEQQRLHHAILLTGTRGVGKTTIARIIAKCLNCEKGISATPCGACNSCLEVDEGRFIDLIEVDAASRTKVEETRDLLDNIFYAPTKGRKKVYLIDEVHMLSKHSFNALLKTLEEPPPYVQFVLATTDPEKIPLTVLSRCLQFNLKRLSVRQIQDRLAEILKQENLSGDDTSLAALANAADGSLRDGLSLLDQAIAYGGGTLREEEVRAMLGTVDRKRLRAVFEALIQRDATLLFKAIEEIDQYVPDYGVLLQEMALWLQKAAMVKALGDSAATSLGEHDEDASRLATAVTPEDLQLYYQIALLARRDLMWAPQPRAGFEMAVLRMLVFVPSEVSSEVSNKIVSANRAPVIPIPPPISPSSSGEGKKRDGDLIPTADNWNSVVETLGLNGSSRQLARHSMLRAADSKEWVLALPAEHSHLATDRSRQLLQEAIEHYLGHAVRLKIEFSDALADTPAQRETNAKRAQQEAMRSEIESDPTVQAFTKTFGATIKTLR